MTSSVANPTAIIRDLVEAPPAVSGRGHERYDDLSQIIRAYNQVTQKLQDSHESLRAQVVRLQQELVSTNAKLQRSKRLAALGEMAAGIAHEIRNPLGAIQLYAGMLVDDLSPHGGQLDRCGLSQNAHKIASAVRGLNAIVNDVLSFARELSPAVTPVSVGQLFDRAADVCGPMITSAGVEVVRLDRQTGGSALSVPADTMLMVQAMLNLIRNAVDAIVQSPPSASGGVGRGVLTLDARREESQVVLVVRDTGPGIADSNIDRIFNPFFTTRNTGTGLGLAIVHRIVDAHGGTISVHNDGGAVFELSLPATTEVAGRRNEREDPTVCAVGVDAVGPTG